MALLNLQIVTPQKTLLQTQCEKVSLPTPLGQITILPHHAPLVSQINSGELIVYNNNQSSPIHVAGGFVEIRPGNEIVILADAAEHFDEIDESRAELAMKKADEAIKNRANISDEEYALAAAALERSLSRLQVARKHAHRKQRPITSEGVFNE